MQRLQNHLFATQYRPYMFLLLITIGIWIHCIHDNYINVDTPWLVVENPILSTGDWSYLPMIWGDLSTGTRLTLGAEYLPIRDLSVLIDFSLFGSQWSFHHLHSLLWYLGGCLGFLAICFNIFGQRLIAWMAALAFAIHPTHIESVAWLANRKDVISLALVMLAILLHLNKSSMLRITIVAIAAYWAKNTAIMLPPLLVIISLLIHQESPRKWQWWVQWIPLTLCFGIGLAITLTVGESVHMFAEARADNFGGQLSIMSQSYARYLSMLIWPNQLSLFYVEPTQTSLLQVQSLLGLTFFFSISLLPVLFWKRSPMTTVALWWIGLGLLPVSQITPIQNLIADRYLLLPSAGLMLLIIEWWPINPRTQVPFIGVIFCWTISLAGFTVSRLPLYHSSMSIWKDVTTKQPYEPRGWTATSALHLKAGHLDHAQAQIEKGFQFLPFHPDLMQSYGSISLNEGDLEDAEYWLSRAWQADNDQRKAANNLAIIYQRTKQLSKARSISEQLVSIHPIYFIGWNTLGAIALEQGDLDRSHQALEQAYTLNRYSTTTLANLGNLAYTEQEYEKAAFWWQQTLSIDPQHQHATDGLIHLQTLLKQP